jgi:hypothetical protein
VTVVTEEKSEILTGSMVVYMAKAMVVVMMGEKERMGLVPMPVGVMGNEKEQVKVRLLSLVLVLRQGHLGHVVPLRMMVN